MRNKFVVLALTLTLFGCSHEGKIKSAVQTSIEQDQKKDLDKLFGTKSTGVALELREFVTKKQSFSFDGIKENGDQAEGTVIIKNINDQDLQGIVMIFGLAEKKINEEKLSLHEAWNKMREDSHTVRMPKNPEDCPMQEKRIHFVVKKDAGAYKVVSMKDLR